MTDSYNQQNINTVPPPSGTFNGSGAVLTEGQIVVQSPTTNNAVILSTGLAQIDVLGVVRQGGEDGGEIELATTGPFNMLVTGAVTRGDFIAASGAAGVGISTGGAGAVGDFAIAVESNPAVGTKLVQCRFKRAEVF